MTAPAALNATDPALLAVATMIAGSSPKTPLPPVRTTVEVVAAYAGVPPTTAPPTTAKALMTTPEMNLFMCFSPYYSYAGV